MPGPFSKSPDAPPSGTHPTKRARADRETLERIFTIPEGDDSTLGRIERALSKNLGDFMRSHVVAEEIPPAELERHFLETRIPEDPVFVSEQADFLMEHVVARSVNVSSPSFVGHMTSALPYFMLPLSKIMTALNQNVVKIETSKAFTPLERQVNGMLHRLVYRRPDDFYRSLVQDKDKALGIFASGGTAANLTALWTARNLLFPASSDFDGIRREGLIASLKHRGWDGLAIVVSRLGHYSFKKAADLLGLGENGLVTVATNPDGKINLTALRETVASLHAARRGIIAIVGVAGSTETGSVDPLDAMADIAESSGCRFHVDAAWGGPTLFSRTYAPLLRGIERADSVVIDAHKQLYAPVAAGIALFQHPTDVAAIEHHARYIVREGSRDLGRFSLEGTRAGTAMLVHSGLRVLGRRGYELLIDDGCAKARAFADMIRATSDFELITEPELNILTYRYAPPDLRALAHSQDPTSRADAHDFLNNMTIALQKTQRATGRSFVSRTALDIGPGADPSRPTHVLRVVIANPLTTIEILRDILNEQRAIAERLLREEFAVAARRLTSASHNP